MATRKLDPLIPDPRDLSESEKLVVKAPATVVGWFPIMGPLLSLGMASAVEPQIASALENRRGKRAKDFVFLLGEKIQKHLDAGHKLRQDWFPDDVATEPAKKIMERGLTIAIRDVENRKNRYLANLVLAIFASNMEETYAYQLLNYGEEVSYQQLCILQMSTLLAMRKNGDDEGVEGYKRLKLARLGASPMKDKHHTVPGQILTILIDCQQLSKMDLITNGQLQDGLFNFSPRKLYCAPIGSVLWRLMRLNTIPDSDILPVVQALSWDY